MSETALTIKILNSAPLDILDSILRAKWANFAGTSRAGGETFLHFATASLPADLDATLNALVTPLVLAVGDGKTQIAADGTETALIGTGDPRIFLDSTAQYYVDYEGALDETPTTVSVTGGRVDLEFSTDVPGSYRIRIHRVGGVEFGYVEIEAV